MNKAKQASKNTKEFVKRLVAVVLAIFAMLPVASAIFSVLYTHNHVIGFANYSLVFSSVVGGFLGLIALYKLLMHKES